MRVENLVAFLCACHLGTRVEGPFKQRGGVMLVAPPGSLKTSIVSVLDAFPDVLLASDLTTRSMVRFRDLAAGGRIRTIVFTDFQKLYERKLEVAANLEGNLRALVDEGFRCAAFEDERTQGPVARAFVVGVMTQEFYRTKFKEWEGSGFARRFLWLNYRLADAELIQRAIVSWRLLEWRDGLAFCIPPKTIPYTTKKSEAAEIARLIKYQPGQEIGQIVMQRAVSALRWSFKTVKKRDKTMAIIRDLSQALGPYGDELVV